MNHQSNLAALFFQTDLVDADRVGPQYSRLVGEATLAKGDAEIGRDG